MSFLILHNIRSAENVGSLFRTADAFGVTRIFLTGYTPAPLDRFKRPVGRIAKTALGAEKTVPWEQAEVADVIARLQSDGVCVVALEQDVRSQSVASYIPVSPWALVLGNEVLGIDPHTLALTDVVLEIPMAGQKESLNVAVAAGVALYALTANN